jgi:hypothetical protein
MLSRRPVGSERQGITPIHTRRKFGCPPCRTVAWVIFAVVLAASVFSLAYFLPRASPAPPPPTQPPVESAPLNTTDYLTIGVQAVFDGVANCTHAGAIDSSCVDLSGYVCANGPMSPSCMPAAGDISSSVCTSPIAAGCIPQALSVTTMAVSQSTFLGTNTSCMSPLLPSCYDISSQSCMSGPLDNNCLPTNPTFGVVTATQLILLNDTIINAQIESQATLSVGELSVNQTLTLDGDATMICEVSVSYISFVLTHKREGSTQSVKAASLLGARPAHWASHCPNRAFPTLSSFTMQA